MSNLEKFLHEVHVAGNDLARIEARVWYRGVHNGNYQLLPSILREPTGRPREPVITNDAGQREWNLWARFKTYATSLLPRSSQSSWEVLSVMQHHGVPTRMLDWTESLAVALYFALEYKEYDQLHEPCLWVLNPFRLNTRSTGKSVIFDSVDRLPENGYEMLMQMIRNREASKPQGVPEWWPPDAPVATSPIWSHDRVIRQQGYFTIHGLKAAPLNEQLGEVVKKIPLPESWHPELRKFIRDAGVDHFTLFPDLDGLARHLRQRYGWK